MRRATALTLSAAAATATALTLAAPAGAEAVSSSSKSESETILRAEPLWSGTGEQVLLSGELFNAKTYRPLGNRPIRIDSKPAGSSTWTTLANLETNAHGSFQLTTRPDRSRTYRVYYRGNAWYKSDQSNWVNQTAKQGTKVRMSGNLKADGTGTRITGRATQLWSSSIRPLRGAYVHIEQAKAYSNYFSHAKTVRTNSHGYYTWKTSTSPKQCYRYRAIYKGNSTWAAKSTIASWSSCT